MHLMGATTMLVAIMVIYVLFVTPITALHNIAFYIGVNAFGEKTKRFLLFRDVAHILEQTELHHELLSLCVFITSVPNRGFLSTST